MPRYLWIADRLREQIALGDYAEGETLPSEGMLRRAHAVSVLTVRRAIAILRDEGLVATQQGRPAQVRVRPPRRRIVLDAGSRLVSRMPTADERAGLGIDPGVPVLEIRRADGTMETLNAELVEVVGSAPLPAPGHRAVASPGAHPPPAVRG
jgi:DNA-binding transcriptional MocR family regulator